MSQKEKLIRRLKACPSDFSFDELVRLMGFLDYALSQKGHTSGSRVMFVSDAHPPLILHRPHPTGILKGYQIRQLIEALEKEELL